MKELLQAGVPIPMAAQAAKQTGNFSSADAQHVIDRQQAALNLMSMILDDIRRGYPTLHDGLNRIIQQAIDNAGTGPDLAERLERETWGGSSQAPASGEAEPSGVWQFYQDGEWRVGMNANRHRENTEEAGIPTRDLYTHPPAKVPERLEALVREAEEACQDDGNQTMRESALAQKWLNSLNAAIALLATPTPATTPETEWVKCADRLPEHGQKVRSRGKDGREFETEYFCYDGQTPRFKLIGKVWDHDNVVEWTATPPQEQ